MLSDFSTANSNCEKNLYVCRVRSPVLYDTLPQYRFFSNTGRVELTPYHFPQSEHPVTDANERPHTASITLRNTALDLMEEGKRARIRQGRECSTEGARSLQSIRLAVVEVPEETAYEICLVWSDVSVAERGLPMSCTASLHRLAIAYNPILPTLNVFLDFDSLYLRLYFGGYMMDVSCLKITFGEPDTWPEDVLRSDHVQKYSNDHEYWTLAHHMMNWMMAHVSLKKRRVFTFAVSNMT